jgi:hypothetical protein
VGSNTHRTQLRRAVDFLATAVLESVPSDKWRVQIGLFAPQPGPVPTDGTVMGAGWCGGYGNLTTNDHAMRTLIQDRPQQQAPGNPYRPLAYSCQSQAESLTGARCLIHGAR